MEQLVARTFDETIGLQDLAERGYAFVDPGDEVSAGIEAIYRDAYSFFDLSAELRIANGLPLGCGYVPFGVEHSGNPERPDQVDYFAVSARTRHHAPHLPAFEARTLHATMIDVFDVLASKTEDLIVGMAGRIGGSECGRRLRAGLQRWSLLQVHRARDLAPGELINTPHEDGHLLTLAHATGPGLELADVHGRFKPASVPRGSMIAMPGSAATLLSAGLIRPLQHRVVAQVHARPRLSLLFFADLDPARCAPWRLGPLNEGVDIGVHVLGNSRRFGVEGFDRE